MLCVLVFRLWETKLILLHAARKQTWPLISFLFFLILVEASTSISTRATRIVSSETRPQPCEVPGSMPSIGTCRVGSF